LSWNVSNATSVAISPAVGTFASSGTTLVAPAATTTYTLTATNAAGSSTAMAQVIVSSGVYTPPPEYTPPPPAFAVTSVTASVSPPSFTGSCPTNFTCSAVITVNAPGTVTYHWERSDGGSSPVQTANFAAAGPQTVTTGWPRDASGAYWVRVRTLTPNEVLSSQAGFSLTCEAPFAVTKVQPKSAPASGTRTCPYAINYTYDITTNGPGTVTYHFEQSDTATSSTQTLNFTAAGTKTVSYTWNVSSSGTYSVRCRTLTPNNMSGNSVPVTVTCE